MAHLAGRGGNVSIGAGAGTAIVGVKSWTLDFTVDMLDTTDFVDGAATDAARTFLPGLSTWSGTFEVVKEAAPQALGTSSTSININLEELDDTTYWRGAAFITGIHASVSVDGLVMYTYDFQGTGNLTEAA